MDEFRTEVKITPSPDKISHKTGTMLIGSCFSENVGEWLAKYKFPVDINPFGPLYNPESIASGIRILLDEKEFRAEDLVSFNGLWISLDHHGRFSHEDRDACLARINERIRTSSQFLREAQNLFITLGSAWVFEHKERGRVVANCHRMPGNMFERRLLTKDEIVNRLSGLARDLMQANPQLKIRFTISPIRHMRDGAFENQVSKATLHISIHELLEKPFLEKAVKSDQASRAGSKPGYFPSYEIMMDDLRDYRFYEADMIHPNEVALKYIWDKFSETYFDGDTIKLLDRIDELIRAKSHRPFNPSSESHCAFLARFLKKTRELAKECPWLDLSEEAEYFGGS